MTAKVGAPPARLHADVPTLADELAELARQVRQKQPSSEQELAPIKIALRAARERLGLSAATSDYRTNAAARQATSEALCAFEAYVTAREEAIGRYHHAVDSHTLTLAKLGGSAAGRDLRLRAAGLASTLAVGLNSLALPAAFASGATAALGAGVVATAASLLAGLALVQSETDRQRSLLAALHLGSDWPSHEHLADAERRLTAGR